MVWWKMHYSTIYCTQLINFILILIFNCLFSNAQFLFSTSIYWCCCTFFFIIVSIWFFDSLWNISRICFPSDTTGATSVTRTAYPSWDPISPPVFSGVQVAQSLAFCVMFCRSLFVAFLLPLYGVAFLDLRLLIGSLVSSNFSYGCKMQIERFNSWIPIFAILI